MSACVCPCPGSRAQPEHPGRGNQQHAWPQPWEEIPVPSKELFTTQLLRAKLALPFVLEKATYLCGSKRRVHKGILALSPALTHPS